MNIKKDKFTNKKFGRGECWTFKKDEWRIPDDYIMSFAGFEKKINYGEQRQAGRRSMWESWNQRKKWFKVVTAFSLFSLKNTITNELKVKLELIIQLHQSVSLEIQHFQWEKYLKLVWFFLAWGLVFFDNLLWSKKLELWISHKTIFVATCKRNKKF